MFGQNFYHEITRKFVIYFGTLFNDVVIVRTDSNGAVVQSMRIPLSYAPKNKMLTRVVQDPSLDKETAITLPRMSFELVGIQYDGDRKRNSIGRVAQKDSSDPNKLKYQYNPVPYNLNFNLWVYVKNREDGTKILEQILPYFMPEWNATLHLIPELSITVDVPVVLNSVTSQELYEGQFETNQVIMWTLDFTMKGNYYGPIKKAPIIKFANTRFFFGGSNNANIVANSSDIVDNMVVYPGLDANGDSTTNPNNAINPLLVEIDDDWDYIVQQSGLVITVEE